MNQSPLPSSLKTYSVLPDNKSPLERALELSLSQQLYNLGNPYPDLLDANKTPVAMLPYLAAEHQVTEWDPAASESQKRHTADNQWQVFRLSGTLAGIRLALAGVDGEAEIKRWYEYGGEPYNFQVRVWITAAPEPAMVSRLHRRIEAAKSERDSFSLGVGIKQAGKLYMGGAVQLAPKIIVGPWVPPVIQAQGRIYNGGAVVAAMRVVAK